MPPSPPLAPLPEYEKFLGELKQRIRTAQVRAGLAVNRELVLLYWGIGRDILERQEKQGWGAKVIDTLARDLGRDFPDMTGFSARNLKYMRAFAEAWPDEQIVQGSLAQLPWYHHIALIEKVTKREEREWYARQAVQNGWSRNVLVHQIESGLHTRQGRALTNFDRTLPAVQSELAQQILKDPYNFDFLSLGPEMLERDLEKGLIEHLRKLILELGSGFSFVASQYHIEVGGQDYSAGPPVLSSAPAMLRRYRSEDRRLRAGVCRQDEFLPVGRGRPAAARRTTGRASESSSVRGETRLSSSTPSGTQTSQWAFRNIS